MLMMVSDVWGGSEHTVTKPVAMVKYCAGIAFDRVPVAFES
jgi:hypothetical protein